MKPELELQSDILNSVLGLIQEKSIDQINIINNYSDRIWVLGVGKASIGMAKEIKNHSNSEIIDGIIISNEMHHGLNEVQVFEGSHPYPTEKSVSASYELLELAREIPAGETVIFCLSGGASSLLCIPPFGIEVEELATTYKLLLESGADIHDINIVRKHLCELKGGQLGQVLHHTNLITLITSDVSDDDLETIGSAPTICDSSTFRDAYQVLKNFDLWDLIPPSVRTHIIRGLDGIVLETPKPGINDHPNHEIMVISKASSLAKRVELALQEKGFNTWVAEDAYNDDVRKVSKMICSKAISILSRDEPIAKPVALIFYGESTVNVKGSGEGGRNQEMALISAISLEGQHFISMLSIGTDGIDGPTDAAGAIISSGTTLKARKEKVSPEEYLQNNDSYHFHEKMGTHVKIGSTGNNVMDLQVVIIE